MKSPTGEQFEIALETAQGTAQAVITQLAAGIREYTLDGVDVVEPFPVDSAPPSAAGIVLAPWPNRTKDAAWTLIAVDGTRSVQQLAITEVPLRNAIHGLLRSAPYELVAKEAASLTLAATIYPQSGYPFLIETEVDYELVEDGLRVTHRFANAGAGDAPVAVGAHPYLRVGEVPSAELSLVVNAASHFEVDERKNVVAEHPVDGTAFDLRTPHLVGELTLDDGFGEAGPGSLAALSAADGRSVELWGDDAVRYVQVFTHRSFATHEAGDVAIALEPMTAPTNALNSGQGMVWLAPGESWSVSWGIRPKGF